MTVQITTTIPTLSRSDPDYNAKADQLASALTEFGTQANSMASEASNLNLTAGQSVGSVLATTGFKGLWSSLTGPLNLPASVWHNNQFWTLVQSVADVTTKVPGVASEWKSFTMSRRRSVNTSEVAAVGELVADNGAGQSLKVSAAAVNLHGGPLKTYSTCTIAGDKLLLAYLSMTNNLYMKAVYPNQGIYWAQTLFASCISCLPKVATLSNGNFVTTYYRASDSKPCFMVISAAGAVVVAETVIVNTAYSGSTLAALPYISVGGINDAKFVVALSDSATAGFAVFNNDGTTYQAFANKGASYTAVGGFSYVCPLVATGTFMVKTGGAGNLAGAVYNTAGVLQSSISSTNVQALRPYMNTMAQSSYGRVLSVASGEAANTLPILSLCSVVNDGLSTTRQIMLPERINMTGAHCSATTLGNGHVLFTFDGTATNGFRNDYARYALSDEEGYIYRTGLLHTDTLLAVNGVQSIGMSVTPLGYNGFYVTWADSGGFLKVLAIRSGFVLGVSAGQFGAVTEYETSGRVVMSSVNILDVGGRAVYYTRDGREVVV